MRRARVNAVRGLRLCLLAAPALWADISTPNDVELGGSLGITSAVTIVRMADETVRIRLEPARHRYVVEVEFLFRNIGHREEQLACRFPLQFSASPVSDFRVFQQRRGWFDREIPWQPVTMIENVTEVWTNWSGRVVTKRFREQADWARFPLRFPAESDARVRVSYEQMLGPYEGVTYVLHTGAGWAGPIGRATIMVEAPSREVAEGLRAPPPWGEGWVDGRYRVWQRHRFEPTRRDNFYLFVPDVLPRPRSDMPPTRLVEPL